MPMCPLTSSPVRFAHSGMFGLTLMLVYAFATPCAVAATYYVDAISGLDKNDGLSEAKAWQTIKKVNATTLIPGDQVRLRRGQIWRETLAIPSSGAAGSPIVFDAFGVGSSPVINGSTRITGWTQVGPAFLKAGVVSPAFVYFNDVRLTKSTGSGQNVGPNQWDWDAAGLWVNVASHPDIGILEVSARNLCVYSAGKSYITLQNITLEKALQQFMQVSAGSAWTLSSIIARNGLAPEVTGARALYFQSVANLSITDADVYGANGDSGISVNGGDTVVIARSKVHDHRGDGIYVASSANIVLEDNVLYGQSGLFADNIQLNKITNYRISRNNLSLQGSDTEKGNIIATGGANGLIDANKAAFGAYGVSCTDSNTIVQSNTVHDHTALSWHSGLYMSTGFVAHDITWRYNISYADNIGILVDGSQSMDQYTNIKIYNNTVVSCKSAGLVAGKINGLFENNILWCPGATRAVYAVASTASGGVWLSDHNDIGPIAPGYLYYLGNSYDTLAALFSATQQDAKSLSVDPLFKAPATLDFNLQGTSPLLNAGVAIPDNLPSQTCLVIGAVQCNDLPSQTRLAAPGGLHVVQ